MHCGLILACSPLCHFAEFDNENQDGANSRTVTDFIDVFRVTCQIVKVALSVADTRKTARMSISVSTGRQSTVRSRSLLV